MRGFLKNAVRAAARGDLDSSALTPEGNALAANEATLESASDTDLMQAFGASLDGFDHPEITSIKQAAESFVFFFRSGAAGERAVSNSSVYNSLYVPAVLASHSQPSASANSSEISAEGGDSTASAGGEHVLPPFEDRLGGNAALMAVQAVKLGARVLASGYMGRETRKLLLSQDPYSGLLANYSESAIEDAVPIFARGENAHRQRERDERNSSGDPIPPELEESNDFPPDAMGPDTIHLILEYSAGETFAGHVPPRANRYILNSDDRMADPIYARNTMEAAAPGYNSDAAILAGLHMFEALPNAEAQRQAIIGLRDPFYQTFQGVAKHVELASVGSQEYMKLLAMEALPAADSVGLNEQELADLYEATGGGYNARLGVPSRDMLVTPQPGSPEACASALRHVISAQRNFRINRIHLHTLAFHMEVRRPGHIDWRDATSALFSGSIRATTKACGGVRAEELGEDDLRLLAPMRVDAGDPVARLQLAVLGRKQVQKEQVLASRGQLARVGVDNLEALKRELSAEALDDDVPVEALGDGDLALLVKRALRKVPRGIDVGFVGMPEPETIALSAEDAEFELQSGLVGKHGTPEWLEAVADRQQQADRRLQKSHPDVFTAAAPSGGSPPKKGGTNGGAAPPSGEEQEDAIPVDPKEGLGYAGIHRKGADGQPVPNRRHWNSLTVSPESPGIQWEWPIRPQRLVYRMSKGTLRLSEAQRRRLELDVDAHTQAVAGEDEETEGEAGMHPELETDALGRDISLPTIPLTDLNEHVLTFAYVPVLVCKHPKSTVGLGDAISSTGLLAALPETTHRGKYAELRDFLNQQEESWVLEGKKSKEEKRTFTLEEATALEQSAYPPIQDADGP